MNKPNEIINIYHLESEEHEINHIFARDYKTRDESIDAFCTRLRYQTTKNFYEFIKSNECEQFGGLRYYAMNSAEFRYLVTVNLTSNRDMRIRIHRDDLVNERVESYGGIDKWISAETIDEQIYIIKSMIRETLSVKDFNKNNKSVKNNKQENKETFLDKIKSKAKKAISYIKKLKVLAV